METGLHIMEAQQARLGLLASLRNLAKSWVLANDKHISFACDSTGHLATEAFNHGQGCRRPIVIEHTGLHDIVRFSTDSIFDHNRFHFDVYCRASDIIIGLMYFFGLLCPIRISENPKPGYMIIEHTVGSTLQSKQQTYFRFIMQS